MQVSWSERKWRWKLLTERQENSSQSMVLVSPRAHTSRIYLLRKEGGHGLISAVDCVTMEHLSLNLFNMFSRVKKCC